MRQSCTVHSSTRDHPISPLLSAGATLHLLCCQVLSTYRDLLVSLVSLLLSKNSTAPSTAALLAPALQLVHHLLQALQLLHRLLQQLELLGQLDGEGRQGELVGTVLTLLCSGTPALT